MGAAAMSVISVLAWSVGLMALAMVYQFATLILEFDQAHDDTRD
jgi:Zn-dependent membrane protease YugP